MTGPFLTGPWKADAAGLVLSVRLTPKGGRDAIDGVEELADGRAVLKIRVRAAPTDGEANSALTKLLAKAFDVASRSVVLTSGASARIKRLHIAGDAAALMTRLETILTKSQVKS